MKNDIFLKISVYYEFKYKLSFYLCFYNGKNRALRFLEIIGNAQNETQNEI